MSYSDKELLNPSYIALVKERNNFNLLRFILAYSVMFNHFSTLTETEPFWFISGGVRVKGFFIISGFLVMFSFLRSPDTHLFFRKRLRRILPAYTLVILLCTLLGLFLTTLPLREFVTSKEFFFYILSNLTTLNFLCPDLPGVFENNPIHAMNASLWTIKVELMLYFTVPIIYKIVKKYNKSWCLLLIYLLSFIYSTTCNYFDDTTQNELYAFLKRQFPGQMMYFCSGMIILAHFPFFKKYIYYILPGSILLFIGRDFILLKIVEPIALASIIISIAYSFKWLNSINKIGTSSYGIYLFHFPIIQTFIHLGLAESNLILTFVLTVVLSTLLGILSWNYVEKPCLYKPK